MYLPIIGSIFESSLTITEKKVLRNHKINSINYTVYSFFGIVLIMLPFIFFVWDLSPEALELKNLLIFIAIIITATFANLLTYYSLKREDVTELEPITLTAPLFTILLAFIFSFFFAAFSTERNYFILALGIISSIAIIIPHLKKSHLRFNKYLWAALIGSFLFSVELVLSKFILSYYNSFTFYFLRCLAIFIITWIVFQPKLKSIKNKVKIMILITSILGVFYRIILYYSYESYGIMFTTIVMSILTPVLIFIFAAVFLKEKIKLKHIISAVIVIICVLTTIILENTEIVHAIIKVLLP